MGHRVPGVRGVDKNNYIPLLNGRTLPIKFRIGEPPVYVVGSAGGGVTSTDGHATLTVPVGALSQDTLLGADRSGGACNALPGTVYTFRPLEQGLAVAAMVSTTYAAKTINPAYPPRPASS